MNILKHPGSDVEFQVDAGYFLADLNVYDREESLGEILGRFDPNLPADLQMLVGTRILGSKRFERLGAEHKRLLLKILREAIANDENLVRYFDPDLFEDGFSLPATWEVQSPKAFFEEIYTQAHDLWEIGKGDTHRK